MGDPICLERSIRTDMGGVKYRVPRQMLDEVDAEMRPLASAELFNSPEYKGLLERWCAAIFGLGYQNALSACQVALNEGPTRRDVDFYLLTNRREFGFQLTEVQEPGRMRGHEYKRPAAEPKWSPAERELRGRLRGPEWIYEGVQKKAQRYRAAGRDLNLLVYADFATDAMPYSDVAAALADFNGMFSSIWIMDSVRLCSTHSFPELGDVKGWHEARPIEEYYL